MKVNRRREETFKGYRMGHLRSVTPAELCFKPFTPPTRASQMETPDVCTNFEFEAYAFWSVLKAPQN